MKLQNIEQHEHDSDSRAQQMSNWRLALSATLHCLLGCGIGELFGMLIAMMLALSNTASIALTIGLGFVFGFGLGIIPLLRARFCFPRAFKQVPGVLDAQVTDALLWGGMLVGLAFGFVAAYPVNYIVVSRGVRHHH